MSSAKKTKEPWALLKSLIALALVVLCLWGAQWQYHRGVDRHARNTVIEERITRDAIALSEIDGNLENNEWQTVSTSGSFDQSQQILLHNRYSEESMGTRS